MLGEETPRLVELIDMESIDAEVDEIFGCSTSASTRAVYISAIARFVAWIWARPQSHKFLTEAFVAETVAQGFCDEHLRTWLRRKPFVSPIRLDELDAQEFCRFLVTQKRADGKPYSKSVMDNFRSSLVFLHSLSGRQLSSEFAARLTLFYKGIKRKTTQERQQTNIRLQEGKEPFTFALYRELAHALLVHDNKNAVFLRLFLVLSWNLMCRAGNTEAIRLAHVGWAEDALTIHFSHMKNDQEGERPGDARHAYANPVIPEVCPILALAVHSMIFGFSADGKLFPGSHQYDQYTKSLKRAMSNGDVAEDLTNTGLTPSDFGSHSARNGAATYVSSCSTSSPSAASICLRAGWSLPGVQNSYIRYEAAGDMIVGRFVSGLPFERAEFATQPSFVANRDSIVDHCISLCFPTAPPSFRKVCEFCIASVVHNASYLVTTLPSTDLLFQTPLFRDKTLLQSMRSCVQCRNYQPIDPIRPTGIPPHIAMLATLSEFKCAVDNVVPAMRDHLREIIHEQQLTLGYGAAAIEATLSRVLTQHGLAAISAPPAPMQDTGTAPQRECPVYSWGGGLRRAEGFTFPKVTFATVGDSSKGHPPYHKLTSRDVSEKKAKRLRELQKQLVERALLTQGIKRDGMDALQAATAFARIQSVLPLPRHTKTGRPRRREQLSWMTLAHGLSQ